MIVRNDITQGTDEWHECRYRKIGGTLSKGLFVKSDTLLIELLAEFAEDFEPPFDSFESFDMQRGTELEPLAMAELIKYTGIEFQSAGWLQCEEINLLGICPDGITECKKFSAEIKCPAKKKHLSTILNNEIPSDNIHQCLHYFTINPLLEKHFFVSFRPENNYKRLFVKELTRSTLIDLGTKSKPNIKSVAEWVLIAKSEAIELQVQINESIKKLEF